MKLNFSLTAALMAAGIMTLGVSCTSKPTGGAIDFTFRTDSIHWADSIGAGADASVVTIRAAIPYESSRAYATVNAWIAKQLGIPEADKVTDLSKAIEHIGMLRLDSIRTELDTLKAQGYKDIQPYEYSWHLTPVYVSDKYVSYADTAYAYVGGAHGSTTFTAAVFSLVDGKQWGYDMFKPESLPAVRGLVIEALRKQFFHASSEEDMASQLLVDPSQIQLPVCPPFFTKTGVRFTYQQYEIAPYSSGMPTCVVSYMDLHNALVPAAYELVE